MTRRPEIPPLAWVSAPPRARTHSPIGRPHGHVLVMQRPGHGLDRWPRDHPRTVQPTSLDPRPKGVPMNRPRRYAPRHRHEVPSFWWFFVRQLRHPWRVTE